MIRELRGKDRVVGWTGSSDFLYLYYVLLFLGTGLLILYYHTSIVTGACKLYLWTQFFLDFFLSSCFLKHNHVHTGHVIVPGFNSYTKLSFVHSNFLPFKYRKLANYINSRSTG